MNTCTSTFIDSRSLYYLNDAIINQATTRQLNCAVNHAIIPDEQQYMLSLSVKQLRQMTHQIQQASIIPLDSRFPTSKISQHNRSIHMNTIQQYT